MKLGFLNKKLRQVTTGTFTPSLSTLSLSAATIAENSVAGTVVGTIIGTTGGSTLSITDTAGTKFALSGNQIVAGATATDYETATTHNITIRETLTGAVGTPKDTVIAIAVTDVTEAALATPTLTNYSTLGAAPLILMWSTTDYSAGMYGQLQIATDSGFSTITQNIIFLVDGESWANLDEDLNLLTPSGTYYARIRTLVENEGGATAVTGFDPAGNAVAFQADASSFSTTFTDTISASAAFLSSVAGIDYNDYATVSGGNLTWTGGSGAGGTGQPCRSTLQQASDYAQVEVTLNTLSGEIDFGMDNRTRDFDASPSHPGIHDSTGFALKLTSGTLIERKYNSGGVSNNVATGAGTYQAADIITVRVKKSTNELWVYRTRSGVTTTLTSAMTIPALASYYFWVSSSDPTSMTVNFGGTTYAKSLDTGVATIWA